MSEPLRLSTPEPVPRVLARHRGSRKLSDPVSASDAEVLAAVIGATGTRTDWAEVLTTVDGLVGLAGLPRESRRQRLGLSLAVAQRLDLVLNLYARLARATRVPGVPLNQPEAVAAWLGPTLGPLSHEELWCIPLDCRSRAIGSGIRVSQGSCDGTDACPRTFFTAALQARAVSVIAVHNHPTGDPFPSAADMAVTKRLVAAGRNLNVACVDHVVVAAGGRYVSLRRDHPHLFS